MVASGSRTMIDCSLSNYIAGLNVWSGRALLGVSSTSVSISLKRFPSDLNRRDSQRVKDERFFVH